MQLNEMRAVHQVSRERRFIRREAIEQPSYDLSGLIEPNSNGVQGFTSGRAQPPVAFEQ